MTSIRPLGPDDLDRFIAVRAVSFPAPDIDEETFRGLLAKRLPYTSGLFVEDELACVVTMYPTTMYLNGESVPMGALAGVASAPEHRRRGLVRTLLLDALELLRRDEVGWCLEYPFDPRFYHRLGWQSVPSGVQLELPSEYLFGGRPPRARRLPLEDFGSLSPIYDSWARRYNFCLTRAEDPRGAWSRLVSDWWLDDGGFLYRLDGAYVLFALSREEGRTILTVEDYAYAKAASRTELFSFIGSLHGQADIVRIHLPADDPLALDHRQRHSRSRWPLQARVVDVAFALAPLASERNAVFAMKVRDELCEWNDGTFRVEIGQDGTKVSAASGKPDVELPIQTLPLLLSGLLTPQSALDQGQASGSREPLDALASLGGGRTLFMPLSDAF